MPDSDPSYRKTEKKGHTDVHSSISLPLITSSQRRFVGGFPSRALSAIVMVAAFTLLSLLAVSQAQAQDQVQNQDGSFTLNLKNADISSLIQTVSRQTGRNFVVDPRVKARVTVISAEPLSEAELYQTFLSVLQVHGFAAVPSGDLIKIVPDVNAKQGPVPAYERDSREGDQLVTQVIKVENVPAAQLVPILRPLVPQQGHLAAYAATNTLIITDRSSNIQRLTDIIADIDRPDSEEVEVVQLQHASSREVISILQSIQSNVAQSGGSTGALRFAPDERTNSILLSGDSASRKRTRELIEKLDTSVESGGNTRVVYLRYASAVDLLEVLTGVSAGQAEIGTGGGGGDEGGQSEGGGGAPTVDSNGILQAPTESAPTASIIRRSGEDAGTPNIDIQADEDTNALIITAPPDEMRSILAVIEQLDIRRAQVLVEAIIADLSENNTSELGVNWAVDGTSSNRPAAYTNLGGATQELAATAFAVENGGAGAQLGTGLSLALGRFGTGGVDFGFLLSAIATDADNNILSTPSLVTMDNQEAEITVGQNVPFVTGTQLSSSNDNPFQTIERQDVGITLKVKPQINEGDNIRMEIEQEVSDVAPERGQRRFRHRDHTHAPSRLPVLIEDGQTTGTRWPDRRQDRRQSRQGSVPGRPAAATVVCSVTRTATKEKRNLMVFLAPADTARSGKCEFLQPREVRPDS